MKSLFAGLFALLISLNAFADWNLEKRRIEFLIESVAQLDAVFVRNSTEHSPEEAAEHLEIKLRYVMSRVNLSTFTAEQFVEQVASKSSLTGKPYMIHFSNGISVPAKDWLLNQLKNFE